MTPYQRKKNSLMRAKKKQRAILTQRDERELCGLKRWIYEQQIEHLEKQ